MRAQLLYWADTNMNRTENARVLRLYNVVEFFFAWWVLLILWAAWVCADSILSRSSSCVDFASEDFISQQSSSWYETCWGWIWWSDQLLLRREPPTTRTFSPASHYGFLRYYSVSYHTKSFLPPHVALLPSTMVHRVILSLKSLLDSCQTCNVPADRLDRLVWTVQWQSEMCDSIYWIVM